ncbi:MAG: hypothetical protein K9H64_08315 [Bacteroidales bacterium]|nr:hypothetical protein [Bacteroidales bacterium]MCF8455835.1 hypothetical protein [Bacteroidales bacterium]
MNSQKEHLENLSEIRSLMERSSRFISLSGLSGVMAGLFALAGAMAAVWYLDFQFYFFDYQDIILNEDGDLKSVPFWFFFVDALLVLTLAIASGILLTMQKAKKQGLSVWDKSAQRLVINLSIPLLTGGVLSVIFLLHNEIHLIAPLTLIFYGLGLVNASKFTLRDVKYLGLFEIVLGLVASYYVGYALLFWALGFGILHIIYGTVMYYKYER